ncbi:MAG: hypothetical protein WCG25_03820 [bacterium]
MKSLFFAFRSSLYFLNSSLHPGYFPPGYGFHLLAKNFALS